jgi:hypothetical protein
VRSPYALGFSYSWRRGTVAGRRLAVGQHVAASALGPDEQEGLLALLAGSDGQNYIIDILNRFLPLVEPAVLAGLNL